MIAAMMGNTAYLTRQDILKFPFPYKMWLVVHLEFCDFLRWNRDGTVVLLDLIALEMYLNSTRSIFNIKNRSVFLQHLEQFQFDRLNALPEAEEDLLLQYKHEHFQRHRLDLLAKIRRHTYQLIGETQLNAKQNEITTTPMDSFCSSEGKSNDNIAEKYLSQRVNERMLGDLCFMSHGGLSNIQKQRLRFQTILNFQHEARILQAKLQASDEHAAAQQVQQRRGSKQEVARNNDMPPPPPPSISTAASEDEQVIELPVELFENPHDSVLHLGDDFRPEYAGYYGNCNKDQIVHFFGDYLPMYEDGSMEVKKIVADFSTTTGSAINHTTNRNGDVMHMENDGYDFNLQTTSTPLATKSMASLSLSSTLQPIFKTDEEEVADHFAANESETDISMDEFIKFKKNVHEHTDSIGVDSGVVVVCENTANMQRADHELLPNIEAQQQQQSSNACANKQITPGAAGDFPQMPAAVKMELKEELESENEANFRNFFSQYRASLNLLYERH